MTTPEPERRRTSSRGAIACVMLLPAAALLQLALSGRAELVERVYSRGVFPPLARALAAVSSLVPFSLAETGVLAVALFTLLGIVKCVRVRRELGLVRAFGRFVLRMTALAGVLYATYVLVWGLNHQRRPFGEEAGYDLAAPEPDELARLAEHLVGEVNAVRPELGEDADGVARMPHDDAELLRLVKRAYESCTELHGGLGAPPGVPKRPLSSPLLSAWWIAGIYSPFTAEAHVNAELPEPEVAFATAHELAHSLGFARENEANYLAWLACSRSADPSLRYSGLLRATRSVISALAATDPERALELAELLHPGVGRDETAIRDFWTGTESWTTRVAQNVNDAYLKSQGHAAGVLSYGMFVELLVAERRTR